MVVGGPHGSFTCIVIISEAEEHWKKGEKEEEHQ